MSVGYLWLSYVRQPAVWKLRLYYADEGNPSTLGEVSRIPIHAQTYGLSSSIHRCGYPAVQCWDANCERNRIAPKGKTKSPNVSTSDAATYTSKRRGMVHRSILSPPEANRVLRKGVFVRSLHRHVEKRRRGSLCMGLADISLTWNAGMYALCDRVKRQQARRINTL